LVPTASAALPPCFNISIPICEHSLDSEATAPRWLGSHGGCGRAETKAARKAKLQKRNAYNMIVASEGLKGKGRGKAEEK